MRAYIGLLSTPEAVRVAAAGLAAKFPPCMLILSLLLLIAPRYSYATAGLAVSGRMLGNALTAPLRGRLVDRHSARTVLPIYLAGYLTALAGLVAVVSIRGAVGAVVALAVASGVCMPPLTALMRNIWKSVADGAMLRTASSLDSAMVDVALITGPAIATWLSLDVSPAAPFVIIGVFTAGTIFLMCRLPNAAVKQKVPRADLRGPAGTRGWLGVLRSWSVRRMLTAYFLFCLALMAVEVALTAYARQHHVTGYAGLYIGALAVGSVVGSLLLGAFSRVRRLHFLFGVHACAMTVLACAAIVAPPKFLLLLCPLAGLAIGSVFSTISITVGDLTPAGHDNEMQSWTTSITMIGNAVGASLGGYVANMHGGLAVLWSAPIVAAVATALTWQNGAM